MLCQNRKNKKRDDDGRRAAKGHCKQHNNNQRTASSYGYLSSRTVLTVRNPSCFLNEKNSHKTIIMTVDTSRPTTAGRQSATTAPSTSSSSPTSAVAPSSQLLGYKSFFKVFVNAKGSKEILAVAFFMAFGIGCVIGVVRGLPSPLRSSPKTRTVYVR
jgi:hypothetical protein